MLLETVFRHHVVETQKSQILTHFQTEQLQSCDQRIQIG